MGHPLIEKVDGSIPDCSSLPNILGQTTEPKFLCDAPVGVYMLEGTKM